MLPENCAVPLLLFHCKVGRDALTLRAVLPDLIYDPAPSSSPTATGPYRADFAQMRAHPRLPLLLRRERYERAASTGDHLHLNFYALYLVRGGQGIHVIDGRPYGIVRGDAYLVAPGSVHSYRNYQQLELDALYFQLSLLSESEIEALRDLSGFWKLFATRDDTARDGAAGAERRLHLPPETYRRAEAAVEELRAEYTASELAAPVLLRANVFRLLVFLARFHQHSASQRPRTETPRTETPRTETPRTERPRTETPRTETPRTERPRTERPQAHTPRTETPRAHTPQAHTPLSTPTATATAGAESAIARARRLCEERFAERLTVSQLAAQAFVSPAHFCVLWAREVGMPPAAYVRQLRLEHARHLLATTTLEVAEVGRQCGFCSAAAFARAFGAAYNLSPRAFRVSRR